MFHRTNTDFILIQAIYKTFGERFGEKNMWPSGGRAPTYHLGECHLVAKSHFGLHPKARRCKISAKPLCELLPK